jgi:hypothetical protein
MLHAMLRELDPPLDALFELTSKLSYRDVRDIMLMAAQSWLSSAAVEALDTTLTRSGTAALNTKEPRIGRWYLSRAGSIDSNFPGRYDRYCEEVHVDSPDPTVVEARIAAAIRAMFPKRDPFDRAAVLAAHRHDRNPIVLLIDYPLPRATLDAVRKNLAIDQVRLVILPGAVMGEAVRTDYADSLIDPPLDETTALNALEAHQTILDQITDAEARDQESS